VTEELTRFARDGVTEQELADAKSGLLELGAMGRTLDDGLAHNLANQLFLGRTMAFTAEQEQHVRAATVPSVNAAIRKYIEPKRVVNVFAGDLRPEGIDPARARK
jgi:zinc protease